MKSAFSNFTFKTDKNQTPEKVITRTVKSYALIEATFCGWFRSFQVPRLYSQDTE
jgi:hypothetical protein